MRLQQLDPSSAVHRAFSSPSDSNRDQVNAKQFTAVYNCLCELCDSSMAVRPCYYGEPKHDNAIYGTHANGMVFLSVIPSQARAAELPCNKP